MGRLKGDFNLWLPLLDMGGTAILTKSCIFFYNIFDQEIFSNAIQAAVCTAEPVSLSFFKMFVVQVFHKSSSHMYAFVILERRTNFSPNRIMWETLNI